MIKLTDEDRARYAPKKKQTNLEKIRAMSAEELAGWLCKHMDCWETDPTCLCPGYDFCRINGDRKNGLITWLESEVEE